MLREKLLEASRQHFLAHIEKHKMNVEVLLTSPVGVAEHPDLMETIEQELSHIADYHDKLEMLNIYF
jgi:ribose 5-phosphate isomerase